MTETTSRENRLIALAGVICERGYAGLSMAVLARDANLSLAELYKFAPNRAAIVAALISHVDLAVLEQLPPWSEADTIRDRLFELLMARFEHLQPFKPMLRVVQHDVRRLPADALQIAATFVRGMRWMAEAAGLNVDGVQGATRVQALAAAYASVLPVWAADDDAGHAKTMAALDRRLRRVETLWRGAWASSDHKPTVARPVNA